jgi:hypothetical protein
MILDRVLMRLGVWKRLSCINIFVEHVMGLLSIELLSRHLAKGAKGATRRHISKAGSGLNHGVIWKYITGTDRRTIRAQTVLRLDASFNTRYAVKYYVFARILAVCRARAITNPTIHSASY